MEMEIKKEIKCEKCIWEPQDNLEKYTHGDINEFCGIIRLLVNRDLTILHQALMLSDEKEQKLCLRQMRSSKFDGQLYNAYCARTLVLDPITYVKNEIVFRFNRLNLN